MGEVVPSLLIRQKNSWRNWTVECLNGRRVQGDVASAVFAYGEPFGRKWNLGREEAASRGQQKGGQQKGLGPRYPNTGPILRAY